MVKPVLVTSAAGGRQGKTGRHVSEMLLKRGIPVRAFVHAIDERSEQLRALGAEIFEGDFLDVRSVQRAVQGTSSVYFAYPVQDGLLDATAAMAVAAREAGITRLVNLVMLQSSVDAPTPRMRQNYLSEQVFEWAGIGAVHVRATVFYENLAALVRSSLPAQGAVRLPWGQEQTVLPLVAAEDVARVAAGLLTSPSLTAGTTYPLVGTVISLKEIIATFARVLGKDVRYEEITDDEWRREALARNYNAHAIEHLSSLWKALRAAGLNPETGTFCGDRHDRKDRRRKAEDVGGVRARRPGRIAGEIGLNFLPGEPGVTMQGRERPAQAHSPLRITGTRLPSACDAVDVDLVGADHPVDVDQALVAALRRDLLLASASRRRRSISNSTGRARCGRRRSRRTAC